KLLGVETRREEGIAHLERALQLEPDKAESNYWYGLALVSRIDAMPPTDIDGRRKLNRKARELVREAIRLGVERRSEAHTLLGHLYKDAGDPVNAERYWRLAATLDPQDAEALTQIGTLLVEKGKFSEAGRTFAAASERQPTDIGILLNAGIAWQ